MAGGETTVGGIIGTLRLDAAQFHSEIEKAIAEVELLNGKNVNVDIKVDSAQAVAGLEATAAAADQVDRESVKVGQSSRSAGQGLGLMAASIIGIGPAIVPLAAGATGLGVAFAGMGAAGILAIVGVKREMEAGTAVGATYGRNLGILNQNLTDLSRTAATNVLGSFQTAVADLQTKMPALNSIIGEFSSITGRTAAALTSGLVAGFIALEPLMRDAGVYVQTLAQRFQSMMSGAGLTSFGDYVRSVFPQVMQTLEHIVETAGRLVVAFAPLGGGVLSMLNAFAAAINAIPLPVLTALATLGPAVFLGFRTWQALAPIVDGLARSLGGVENMSAAAANGMRALNIATGVIGIAVTALMLLFTANAESTRQSAQAANDYADALRASNGALDESITKLAAKNLQDAGALTAANNLGLSLSTVTQAALGNADAISTVDGHIATLRQGFIESGADAGTFGADVNTLTGAIGLNNTALQTGIQTNHNMAAATGATTPALDAASTAYTKAGQAARDLAAQASNLDVALGGQASRYGTTTTALDTYYQAQAKAGQQTEATAFKMFMENNAAGILKGSLDALNGVHLSAAQAQQQFDQSLVGMQSAAKGAKLSIDGMSDASVTLRGSLLNQIQSAQGSAEAFGQMAGSTTAGTTKLGELRTAIIDNAVAHGVNRQAVTEYVDSFLKIPKDVPPTKLDVDKTAADKKLADANAALKAIGAERPVSVIDANKQPLVDKAGEARARLLELQAQRTDPLVTANTGAALGSISGAKQRLQELNATRADPVVSVVDDASVRISSILGLLSQVTNRTSTVTTNYVGVYSNKPAPDFTAPSADGNIFKAFAGGGFEDHVAQIAPAGAMRLWAEPETGGEAYIPLAPAKRARSREIWEETGKLLGAGGGGATVTNHFNMPEVDAYAMAREASRLMMAGV